jgi:hypothetical protein
METPFSSTVIRLAGCRATDLMSFRAMNTDCKEEHLGSRRSLIVFITALVLLCFSVVAYGLHVRKSADALIQEAGRIRSIVDVKQQVTLWQRTSRGYSESQSPDGGGRAYQVRVGNGALAALRVVPKTEVLLQVVTRSGELDLVVLGMYSAESSVWVQEEFAANASGSLAVNTQRDESGKPIKTFISFPARLDERKKKSAFALAANCLVRPGGCENTEEILPALHELEKAAYAPITATR